MITILDIKDNTFLICYTFWNTSLNTTFVVELCGLLSLSWIKIFNPDLLQTLETTTYN